MKFHKKENILCFSRKELLGLFKIAKKTQLLNKMIEKKLSFDDLNKDYSKMKDVADTVGDRGAQNRDEHEIFASLFIFVNFYEEGSEICFEVRGFEPDKSKITTLEDLIKFREGVGTSDFIIKSKDSFRKFQLKRYRGGLNTQELFDFIKDKVAHYGNDLGDTNFLVVLQAPAYTAFIIDFHELHNKIKSLSLKFQAEILISYNHNNKKQVIIQVHPRLVKIEIPIQNLSAQLNQLA